MSVRNFCLLIISATMLLAITSCQKDNKNDSTHLKIKLTDNPYQASEVNVDIMEVNIKLNNDSAGWTRLETHAGIYNLLDLQNGIDTVLAQGVIPTGTLKEIRFVLGNENSIKIGDAAYPLTIPSGAESGLKIKLNKTLNASLDSLLIDFDAALSILQEGTGDYKLKPVLKIK
ncbi:DUF4382 domain-containing protein [Agriterribacter sp.]|uniref:DUF4382 domain-containing protein n=1 Tax=Agriterribacter sp. TaxID=2821509 RepID=UPI002CD843C6|nr:DUF4382 domain-containing protein [Agriterribacter sp.]HTN06254.1 DUF4382 domain-containing protein [Agriterribacter sp.]